MRLSRETVLVWNKNKENQILILDKKENKMEAVLYAGLPVRD